MKSTGRILSALSAAFLALSLSGSAPSATNPCARYSSPDGRQFRMQEGYFTKGGKDYRFLFCADPMAGFLEGKGDKVMASYMRRVAAVEGLSGKDIAREVAFISYAEARSIPGGPYSREPPAGSFEPSIVEAMGNDGKTTYCAPLFEVEADGSYSLSAIASSCETAP